MTFGGLVTPSTLALEVPNKWPGTRDDNTESLRFAVQLAPCGHPLYVMRVWWNA